MPNFMSIIETVAEMWPFFDFQSFLCFMRVWTIHEVSLVVFIAVQNLVVISIVLLCSLAVLDPRAGHTLDLLSLCISDFCHSD